MAAVNKIKMHSYFSLCYICYSSMWIIDCLVKYLWSHCIWYLLVIFFHQKRSQRRARSFEHTALVISNIYRHLLMAQNSDRSTFFTLSAWLLALLWWYLVFARFVYRFLECIQMFASHLSEQNSEQPFFCTFLVFFSQFVVVVASTLLWNDTYGSCLEWFVTQFEQQTAL